MVNVSVQNLGDVAIFQCQGRIAANDEIVILRNVVLTREDTSTLVLDLSNVVGIDAGGLGALVSVRAWTRSHGIRLVLTNVLDSIQKVLAVTNLDRVFEICSEKECIDLLYRSVSTVPPSRPCPDQPKIAALKEDRNYAV